MKKLSLFVFLFLLYALPSRAQVTVTGTVTDAGSVAWAGGSFRITFVPVAGFPGPYYSGGVVFPTSTTYTGTLDGTGSFSVSMTANNTITPVATQWAFNFCPLADAGCYTTTLSITGAGSITGSITPPAITVQASNGKQPKAYTDAEITQPVVGFTYFNLTSNTLKMCTVAVPCTWVAVGTGSGAVSSVFTRTGAVTAQSGDYTLDQIGNPAANTSFSFGSFTLGLNATGIFTSGQMNEAFFNRIGVSTCLADVGNTGITDVVGACAEIPTSGVTNAWTDAFGAYVYNANPNQTGLFGKVQGVGLYTNAVCAANNTKCEGISPQATSKTSLTGVILTAIEAGIFSQNSSDSGAAVLASFENSNGQPTGDNMPAFLVQTPTASGTFTTGFECQPGAISATKFTSCVTAGKISNSPSTGSQLIAFVANNGSADIAAGLTLSRDGTEQLSATVPFTATSFSTYLTSTAALSLNQLVKIDTANANAVVVCTTADIICTGFVAEVTSFNCGIGSTICPVIEVPGSVALGILGTGTCAIGNWVIVDTTTNGRVKCATVQPVAWQGFALAANSTVGTTFDVLVSPGGASNVNAKTFSTATNCAVNSVSPAACGSAAAGVFAIPASQTTYTVNTSAVTANSRIFLQSTTDNTGIPSAPTCADPALTAATSPSARSAGTSFTLQLTSNAGITCYNYFIVN